MLNTILGSFSSGVAPVTSSYESIATVTVGSGGSSSISFTSIPATYTHLQIRAIARTTVTSDTDFMALQFNGDTGSNYVHHSLFGNGSTAGAGVDRPVSFAIAQRLATNQNGSSIFGAVVMDILDYTNTNKYTTTRNIGGYDANGSGQIFLESNLWQNTSAINSITITPSNPGSFAFTQYSQFALYGIKGV